MGKFSKHFVCKNNNIIKLLILVYLLIKSFFNRIVHMQQFVCAIL